MVKNSDSIWNRATASSAGNIAKNKTQMGGKEIQRKLGLDDEGHQNIFDKSPISMMDIVTQMWSSKNSKVANALNPHGEREKSEIPHGKTNYLDDEDNLYHDKKKVD